MSIHIREATAGDEADVIALVQQLAHSIGEASPINEPFVTRFLSLPGSHVLLAEEEGRVVGLLSYSVRPNLYHAGDIGLIEELVVRQAHRGRGVGSALLSHVLQRLASAGCVEVSVATLSDNEPAKRLYRSHGLMDEALLLQKHFLATA